MHGDWAYGLSNDWESFDAEKNTPDEL